MGCKQSIMLKIGDTHSMGSVTVMMNGRDKLPFSIGNKASLSSYRLHHRSSPVSLRFFAARFRRIAGAYLYQVTHVSAIPPCPKGQTRRSVSKPRVGIWNARS